MKKIFKIKNWLVLIPGVLFSALALSAGTNYVSLTVISSTVNLTVANLATVMVDVSIIAGIGFVIAAFFKFHQHKQNPQQVQMSQGISLLLIGCGLTLIPLLIPTGGAAVLGTKGATPAKVGGTAIHNLIGNGT